MGLKEKLLKQGSSLTNTDGAKPNQFITPPLNPKALIKSQLDLDGLPPTVIGKLPYIDNLPK